MNKERMLAIARRHGATLMHTQEGHEVVCLDPSSFERFCTELIAKAAQQPAGDVVMDAVRLDALGTPGWELSMNSDPECMPDELWQVHRVSGGRNDREWTLIGEGANPRAAIDSAIAASGRQE